LMVPMTFFMAVPIEKEPRAQHVDSKQ